MEDWQQWQIRADQIASALEKEVGELDTDFFGDTDASTFQGFWPRFRDLKERVRIAPAIRLEAKLALERKLRDLGSKAYKGQEGTYARSSERKAELLSLIQERREAGEHAQSPRDMRNIRRALDDVRAQFDVSTPLVPHDRQAVWDAWRDASQYVWKRLTDQWDENERFLTELISTGREQLEAGNASGARQSAGQFFDAVRNRECRQNVLTSLRARAAELRDEAGKMEERRKIARPEPQRRQFVAPTAGWKAELAQNQAVLPRLIEDVNTIERQIRESSSILDQAMLRGTLVDKKRKMSDLERANRTLAQRIERAEEVPLITAG